MYSFIFGGTGTGKTYTAFSDCISASLKETDECSHFLLLVPEQSTTGAEKEIVRMHPNHATDNIDILSFNRLAYKVFEELEIINPDILDDMSKAMILRKLGLKHEDELIVWKNRFDKPGFIDSLKSMISELMQYGISPEQLGEIAKTKVPARLKNKLHDLSLIYTAFAEEIAGKHITVEEVPDILSRVIGKSSIINGATIYLDGFTGFTPIQYKIIENFLVYAKKVVFTVTLDEANNPFEIGNELFRMSKDMIGRITEIAGRNGIGHGEDVKLPSKSIYDRKVRLIHAQNISEEAEWIASDISRHIRKGGYRYKDIAIVLSDSETYSLELKHELKLSGIPYYQDENLSLSFNPLVAMIHAALDVIKNNYSYESVVRYLKTGMVPGDETIIDAMDNYMYVCGKRGYKRLTSDWDMMPKELEGNVELSQLNEYRKEVISNLEVLREAFKGPASTARDKAEAIFKLEELNGCKDRLTELAEEFEATGDKERTREYSECFERVNELLVRMAELLSDERISADEFTEIFLAGAAQIKLGMIPSGSDRVVIGDLTRTRLEHIKLLYVAGANDGKLPKLLSRNSVITDTEKESLKETGLELSPTVKEDLYIQRFYLYRLFTKPEKELAVSYASVDTSGSSLQPSYIVKQLKGIYNIERIEDAKEYTEIYDTNSLIRLLSSKLTEIRAEGIGHADDYFDALYAYAINEPDLHEKLTLMTAAALYAYRKEKLSKEVADKIYTDKLYASVSRLERFGSCPYAYFLNYGIKLHELNRFSMEAVDIGNLCHAALEKIYAISAKEQRKVSEMDNEAREKLVRECVAQAVLDDAYAKYSDTAKNRYIVSRVTRVIDRTLWGLVNHLDNTEFEPTAFEMKFSYIDGIEAMNFDLGNGKSMGLSGKIDRVDLVKTDTGIGIRIIDYKSGNKTFDYSNIINGTDLQLVMYMNAVEELMRRKYTDREVEGKEMYYFTVQDPVIPSSKITSRTTADQALLKAMKPSGENDPEHIRKLIPYVRGKALEYGKDITGGRVDIEPDYSDSDHSACTYCPYRAVCGFDRKLEGFRFKPKKKVNADNVWEILDK